MTEQELRAAGLEAAVTYTASAVAAGASVPSLEDLTAIAERLAHWVGTGELPRVRGGR